MAVPSVVAVTLAAAACLGAVNGKVFSRCELVRELSQPRHRIPRDRLATWVCIATLESHLDTSAVGHLNVDGSGDHGIFQLSDQYWCSPPGHGHACGLNCNRLEDDDITDDVVCARRVYRATKRRTGDGFAAWSVYPLCRDAAAFVEGCDDEEEEQPSAMEYSVVKPSSGRPENSSSTGSSVDWDSSSTSTSTTTSTSTSTSTETTLTDVYSSSSATEDAKSSQRSLHQLQLALTKPDGPFVGYKLVSDEDRRAIMDFLGRTTFGKSEGRGDGVLAASLGETSSTSGPSPLTAWLDVHYDPRFLDRP